VRHQEQNGAIRNRDPALVTRVRLALIEDPLDTWVQHVSRRAGRSGSGKGLARNRPPFGSNEPPTWDSVALRNRHPLGGCRQAHCDCRGLQLVAVVCRHDLADEVGKISRAEPLHHPGAIVLDRSRADAEANCYLLV